MSLMGDVQKFIESHPGCTSSDIANAFADFPRKSVLQSASKLRQCGRVAIALKVKLAGILLLRQTYSRIRSQISGLNLYGAVMSEPTTRR